MKTLLLLVLGEILSVGNNDVEVSVMVWENDRVEYVKKYMDLEEFPCNPYPGMLFYYTDHGQLRCGEPDPK